MSLIRRTTRISLPAALVVAASFGLPLTVAAQAQAPANDPLPIRTITLYRSGVGAFERTGQVTGDATVGLRFQTDQINDILKSLVLLDLDGGTIGPVSYGSKEPLSRRLDAFRIDIASNPSIPDIFGQLRGEQAKLILTDGAAEGTILGIEKRFTTIGGEKPSFLEEPYVTLVTSSGIRAIAVSQIRSFELADAELAAELNSALAMLADNRADQNKTVDLNFSGQGARDIFVAYVHEMPVWKTSYRLVLPEKDADKPTMQGWAIVENTTDQDWKDVRLSLASGRPVAFTMDLYEPLFAYRPVVPVPFAAGLMPRLYEAGLRDKEAGAFGGVATLAKDDSPERRERQLKAGRAMEADMAAPAAAPMPADYTEGFQNFQSAATGAEIGEQFFYTLDMPISIERQRSAMVPILSAPVSGRRVSIFDGASGAKNPMRGVQLTNDSGLSLMPGPIAVYDASAYAGDAQIPSTSRGQTQLLSYAADLDVTATTESAYDQTINKFRIVSGVLEQKLSRKVSTTYAFQNNDAARDRTMIIENQRQGSDWETTSPKPFETTDTLQRFELTIPKGGDAKTTIVQERTDFESMGLINCDTSRLGEWTTGGQMSKAVADAIRTAAGIQGEINRIASDISSLDQETARISNDQDRIRQNMNTIDRTSDLYTRYMKTLNEQETRLEEMHTQRIQLESDRTAKQRELADFLNNLNVE